MKKYFLRVLILILSIIALCFFVSACDKQSEEEHVHDYSKEVVSPTCTELGYTLYSCECGYEIKGEYISAKGHEYTKIVTNPTCISIGFTTYKCDCGFSYLSDYVSAKGHEYTKKVTNPTCTFVGYTTYTCNCGASYVADYISAKGHEYKTQTTNPTCVSLGYTTYTCDCGYSFVSDYISQIPHDFNEEVIEPDCENNGYTEHICDCGASYKSDFTNATGHSYEQSIEEDATCLSEGVYKYVCSRCQDDYTESYSLSPLTSSEIFAIANESTAEVIAYDSKGSAFKLGTAFVYAENGVFATNYHVLKGAYSAKITFAGNSYDITKVLAYDGTLDLAVFQTELTGLVPLKHCLNTHAEGNTVYAFGSSRGLTATFSKGVITSSERKINGKVCVQHDAAISGGNSGGPLIDEFGHLIGVNTMQVSDAQNLNFAVSVKEFSKLSFSSGKTLAELFEMTDPITKLKNYVMDNGERIGADYSMVIASNLYSDGTTTYDRILYYLTDTDEILIALRIGNECEVGIFIETVSSEYLWAYADAYGYKMQGIIDGTEFDDSSLLDYKNSHNIGDYYLAAQIRSNATLLIQLMLMNFDLDYQNVGVTAGDLGFSNF